MNVFFSIRYNLPKKWSDYEWNHSYDPITRPYKRHPFSDIIPFYKTPLKMRIKTVWGSFFAITEHFSPYFGHMVNCTILKIWSLWKSGHIGHCIYLRCINRWRRCWYTWTSRRHGSEAKSRNWWIRIPWFTSIYSLPRIEIKWIL